MNDVSLNPEIVELEAEMEMEMPQYPVIPNPEGEPTAEITKMGIDDVIYEVTDAEARATLPTKVDKVEGKGLSTNDYDDTAKEIVDGVTSALELKADKSDTYTKSEVNYALANKVDKVEGKGLSENDYTDEEKAKVGEIDNKLDKTETAVNSNGLVIATPVTDTAPYIYRQTPVKESFKAFMKKIVGASVVWNQLGFQTGYSATGQYSPLFRSSSQSLKVDTLSGHKYLISFIQPSGCGVYRQNRPGLTAGYQGYPAPTSNTRISFLANCTESKTQLDIGGLISKLATTEESYYLTNAIFTDLTAMFGTTIADYVYTLETSQSGSGIAWLQSYGFFTEDYYAYKQNKLESGCVSAHKTYDGETLLTNTELSPITLRGLFKLSTNKLTVDGDEYNADGSVTRKYGIVDLGSLDWNYDSSAPRFMVGYSSAKPVSANSVIGNLICEKYTTISLNDVYGENTNKAIAISTGSYISIVDKDYTNPQTFKTAMSGVYLIYELATPTTEQTTPFTETEIVGSTEEFIDYEVAQDNRDVAIPVGTETDYYQEMKLPSLPTTSGNHNLIYNVATGFGWS